MIRQFRSEDAEPCSSMLCACLRNDSNLSPSLREGLLRAESPGKMLERADLYYIAVFDEAGEVLGFGGLELNEIRLLYVAPEHQRKGIGRAILDHLESMVPSGLFSDIFVYSTLSSTDFYCACGYTGRGEYSFECGGEILRTVFMTKLTCGGKSV